MTTHTLSALSPTTSVSFAAKKTTTTRGVRGVSRSRRVASRGVVVVRARAVEEPPALNAVERSARSMGLDTSEGVFGFTPFAELWTGRLAMMGFTVGLAEELWTGDGILAQIGIACPNPIATSILTLGLVGGTVAGAAKTLKSAQDGTMTMRTFKRWCDLLGADQDEAARALSVDIKKMERNGFLAPDDLAAIAEARRSNPADAVLSMDGKAEAMAAAAAMKIAAAEAGEAAEASMMERDLAVGMPPMEIGAGVDAEMRYALDVEMNNGRWAMLGFALAVFLEASTGNGIMGQLIGYAKALGVLGPDSGF